MALQRATRGFITAQHRGLGPRTRGARRIRRRLPLSPLHVVDAEPGQVRATSLCGTPRLLVVDEQWDAGIGGCQACRLLAEGRAGR
ncbi:hypothetical protein PO878_08850 [Iamia majanohamensis]|uniref:Uncharacterized protein n=1 Tax=Iamia majanohamensis TaxID=467976 RepID=A0AAE9YIW1_9ACTN|nr:hypothetical protein [Iamia majanohamensis]WCO68831.1 hypothetical protein PO878_08850 [Iamia majanohamensis]